MLVLLSIYLGQMSGNHSFLSSPQFLTMRRKKTSLQGEIATLEESKPQPPRRERSGMLHELSSFGYDHVTWSVTL